MGKAKRFNSYDSDVEDKRKIAQNYGLARQNLSGIGSSFRSSPLSPITSSSNPDAFTSGADNLGNHLATQDINLSNNELDNFNKLNQQNANTTGSLNFVFDASMRWKNTAGTGEAIFRFGSGDAFSFDHQINGTDIVLSGNLTVNGATALGNASTDSIFTIGTISSLYALDLEGGGRVKSNDSSEIGLFIKNETGTLGTEGTVQIPEATSTTAPTNTQLDGTFGAFTGAVGLFRDTDTTTNSRFYIRGSDSNWYYSFLTQQT